MQNFSMALLVLAGVVINTSVASAQKTDACKECRNFHQACVKAHSQVACKTDYDICMKHCRKS